MTQCLFEGRKLRAICILLTFSMLLIRNTVIRQISITVFSMQAFLATICKFELICKHYPYIFPTKCPSVVHSLKKVEPLDLGPSYLAWWTHGVMQVNKCPDCSIPTPLAGAGPHGQLASLPLSPPRTCFWLIRLRCISFQFRIGQNCIGRNTLLLYTWYRSYHYQIQDCTAQSMNAKRLQVKLVGMRSNVYWAWIVTGLCWRAKLKKMTMPDNMSSYQISIDKVLNQGVFD